MFKTIILLCHFLCLTISGRSYYFNELPYLTGSGNVKNIHYTNTAPAPISYMSANRPTQYEKSFYYFSAPDEHFEQRHNELNRKHTRSTEKNLQVIFVKSAEQKVYENSALSLANNAIKQQQQQQHQQAQAYVFNKQFNIKSLLQNPQIPQLAGGRSSQQQMPEVHFINYKTDAEANQVIQQVIRAHNVEIPNDGRVQAAIRVPVVKSGRKAAAKDTTNHAHSVLSVHKSYAMNYLPTGVDVVPGSSYIPLRRI